MIRIIVLAIIGYLAYRIAKKWIHAQIRSHRVSGKDVGQIDDIMIKDPQCGTYFPRRDGISLQEGGSELLFCSHECRDKYVTLHSRAGE